MSNENAVTDYTELPWTKKWINIAIIYVLIMPVGLILMWNGDVYINKKDENGELKKIAVFQKIALTLLMFVLIFRVLK